MAQPKKSQNCQVGGMKDERGRERDRDGGGGWVGGWGGERDGLRCVSCMLHALLSLSLPLPLSLSLK
jgi:hypothetical protein